MAALNHLELMKLVLNSLGGSATAEQVQKILVPEVIEADWKKWWEMVKREMKKDGHFLVPLKKSQPIIYMEEEVSTQNRLMEEFMAAKGLKARLVVTSELLKNQNDLEDPKTAFPQAIAILDNEIRTHAQTQPSLALEGIFMRDDLSKALELPLAEDAVRATTIWTQGIDPAEVFDQMAAAKHRQGLASFREAFPDNWSDILLDLVNRSSARFCGECVRLLGEIGRMDDLKALLIRLVNQHAASSELLLWLAKNRSDAFADVLGPEVFRAMLTSMERDQFSDKKSSRLGDLILDDKALIVDLIHSADLEIVKDLTRTLRYSPVYDDMDKRSLLARIVKTYPSIQSLITGDASRQEAGLIVSWESLERRKDEYDKLVHKKIPANSKEIAIARSYGDLRENHEYKAAKEMHRLLLKRKAELEHDLGKARGTDFSDVSTDRVGIGTIVKVTDLGNQESEDFKILGAWDSDPDNGVISYLTPVAQALMSRTSGETVDLELEGSNRQYRVESIAAYLPKASGEQPGVSEPEEPKQSPETTPTGQ